MVKRNRRPVPKDDKSVSNRPVPKSAKWHFGDRHLSAKGGNDGKSKDNFCVQ